MKRSTQKQYKKQRRRLERVVSDLMRRHEMTKASLSQQSKDAWLYAYVLKRISREEFQKGIGMNSTIVDMVLPKEEQTDKNGEW